MSETLHKGWLYTRSNEKFAPSTLIESVYTRDGTLYDSVIQEDIAAIATKFSNINVNDDDTFYIVDKSNYIVMAVDKDGVTSLNFYTPEGDLNSALAAITALKNKDESLEASISENNGLIQDLANKIANINTNDMSSFIITDESGNKIMEVDSNGVNSVDFRALDENGNKVITLLELNEIVSNIKLDFSNEIAALVQKDSEQDAAIEALANKTEHIDNNDTSKFVIVDNDKNIAFQVTEDGYTQGVDFITLDTSSNKKYSLNEIGENVGQLNNITSTHTSQINDLNKNFGKLTDDDTFNILYKDGTFKVVDENSDEILTANASVVSGTDFQTTDGVSLTALNNRTTGIEANGEQSTFVIADNDGYKIMEVNDTGVHSINFISTYVEDGETKSYNLNTLGLNNSNHADRISDIESALGLQNAEFRISVSGNNFIVKNESLTQILKANETTIEAANFTTTEGYNLNDIYNRTQKISYADSKTAIDSELNIANNVTGNDFILNSNAEISLSKIATRMTDAEDKIGDVEAALGLTGSIFNIRMEDSDSKFIVEDNNQNSIINATTSNITLGGDNSVVYAGNFDAGTYDLNDIGGRTQKISYTDNVTTINSNVSATNFITDNYNLNNLGGRIVAAEDQISIIKTILGNSDDNSFNIFYENETLKVTDENNKEIFTASATVATAADFSTPQVASLNGLNTRTAGIEASGEDQAFVIADNGGNKIMEVNSAGITSVNFISNVKDANGEYYNLNQIGLNTDDSLNRIANIENALGLDDELFNIKMESGGADTTLIVQNDSNETIINATVAAITLGKDYDSNVTSGNFTTKNYNLNNIGDRIQKIAYADNVTTISEALSVTDIITATNNITAKDFILSSNSDITLSTVESRLLDNESWTAEIATALGQAAANAAFNIRMSDDNNTFIVTNETNNPIINASATNIAFGNNLLVLDATKNTATFNSVITATAKDFISSSSPSYGLNDIGARTQKINFADSITTINSAVQTPNNITAADFIISATSTSVNDSITALNGNVESLQDILGYNAGLYNIDLSNDSDDTFSILDQYNNKILQVDDQGLTTINIIVKTDASALNLVTNGIWISPDPEGNDIITFG